MATDGGAAPTSAPPAKRARRAPAAAAAADAGDAAARHRSGARGAAVATRGIADKKLKGRLRYAEGIVRDAQAGAAKVGEWLLPAEAGSLEAEGLERTWQFSRAAVAGAAEAGAARRAFDLALPALGPYRLDFSRSGRHLLLGGRRGHLAVLDWARARAVCEVQVRETVRDVRFLHNEGYFAAAQKRHVYIYDKRGIEIHCLTEHVDVSRLEFLPYHFLLASIGAQGVLRYQDTSTGQVVAQHRTRLGPCDALRQNPWNGVLCAGHGNGVVTMWTPTSSAPAVKMLCHHGPVRALAVDAQGRYLVTAGADAQVKVWDVRTYRPLHAYFSRAPADALDISQRGLLAVGHGRRVAVWSGALGSKAAVPMLDHTLPEGSLAALRFVPYEDVLAAGHGGGLSTALVPGAGEANYDSHVADPFQGRAARREAEVHQLLDKLQPEMIALDPGAVGRVARPAAEVQAARAAEAAAANEAAIAKQRAKNEAKKPMKGKNKPSRRRGKKQQNVIDERRPAVKAAMRAEGVATAEAGRRPAGAAAAAAAAAAELPAGVPRALARFYQKGGAARP
jgi:U3 small nucleolar RNA-associated protein 7